MANAYALGTKVNLTTLAVGDGGGDYYEPTESQAALKHQVWSGNINSINVDSQNSNWIKISAIIPTSDGGFTIREAGIFDDSGNLIAVGKYPETYKPVLSEGSSKDLTINIILEISNTSSVTLKVDPTVVLATKNDLNNLAGTGRTNETVKGAYDKINALAGEGNTTTVKALADEVASNLTSLDNLHQEVDSHTADSTTYSIAKSNLDSNGIYTTVQHKRKDGTLILSSVLSGGTSPQYTTRAETYYKTDGTTVDKTATYTITYDTNGMVASEVLQ
jgi:phage-related tail fiber protein